MHVCARDDVCCCSTVRLPAWTVGFRHIRGRVCSACVRVFGEMSPFLFRFAQFLLQDVTRARCVRVDTSKVLGFIWKKHVLSQILLLLTSIFYETQWHYAA